jgi:hypothetical protein
LHNTSQINGDNRNNVRYVTSGNFRHKKREYLKVNELERNSNIKNIRDLQTEA